MGIDSSLVDAEISEYKRKNAGKQPKQTGEVQKSPVPLLSGLEQFADQPIVSKKKRANSYQQRMEEIERRKTNMAENAKATMLYLNGQSRQVKSARRIEECAYFKPVEKPDVDKDFKFSDGSPLNWKWSQDYGKSSGTMETIKEEDPTVPVEEVIQKQADFTLFIPAREGQLPSMDQLVTHRE